MEEQKEHLAISVEQGYLTYFEDDSGTDDESRTSRYRVFIIWIVLIAMAPILFLVVSIVAMLLLPLMLAIFSIALIVQVLKCDDDNTEMRASKYALARMLLVCFCFLFTELLLSMLICGVSPNLKHWHFQEVSLTRWIGVLAIICFCFIFSIALGVLGLNRSRYTASGEKIHYYGGLIGVINCLIYLLALFSVTRVSPIFKEHTILSHPTYKWAGVVVLVVLGHHVVCIFTSLVTASLRDDISMRRRVGVMAIACEKLRGIVPLLTSTQRWKRYKDHYAEGLRRSFNFMLTALLLLLTWILYFGSRLNRSLPDIREAYDFGWWTFVCILVLAFLLLVKSGMFLTWQARVVCNRFGEHTARAATQLYLIAIIAGPNSKFDSFGLWENVKADLQEGEEEEEETKDLGNSEAEERKKANVDWRARYILLGGNRDVPSARDMMRMARYFVAAEVPLSREGYVRDFVEEWSRLNKTEESPVRNLAGGKIDGKDLALLVNQLDEDGVDTRDIQEWIVKYLRLCLELGRTLAGSMELMDCLNNIMTVLLVFTMIIVWLLLSRIGATKLLVLIATPIVSASFIFGDSAKTLFQGIMFTYVKRPFDVREVCKINDTQVRIQRIGIWRTICSKVGTTNEVIIYPNTVLANTPIVKYNDQLNPNKCLVPNEELDPNKDNSAPHEPSSNDKLEAHRVAE